MKLAWKALLGFGILMMLIAFGFDTTVPTGGGDRVHNIGLQGQQQMLLILGCVAFLAGVMLFGIARLKQTPEEDNKAREAKEAGLKMVAKTVDTVVSDAGAAGKGLAQVIRAAWSYVRRWHILVIGGVLVCAAVLFPPHKFKTWDDRGLVVDVTVYQMIGTFEEDIDDSRLLVELVAIFGICALGLLMCRRRPTGPSTGKHPLN